MAHNRCQNEQATSLWQAQHLIHDLRYALGAYRLTTAGAMRHTQARKEQTEIVVDLGHGSHGRDLRLSPFALCAPGCAALRSEEHTSELQSLAYLVCRLLL